MSSEYYDSLETRDPQVREAGQFKELPAHLHRVSRRAGFVKQQLDGIDIDSLCSREALARVPVVRKSELIDIQQRSLPFGGMVACEKGALRRVFASPGPIFEPETNRRDSWRISRALFAAGVREGMLVHNTFSYHFVPAGMMLESGIFQLGCTVLPAGTGQTEYQVSTIAMLKPQVYTGTPSFLKIILDHAEQSDADVSSISMALVSGEALPPSLRSQFDQRGVKVKQAYATADAGLIAYESEAMEGLIVDEGVIVEIVQPGTDAPVAEGEVGEVVVTVFSEDYPLLRFGTGDMSCVMEGRSPCGRTNMRIKGWMGRADQSTKIRGLFVHPSYVAAIVKRFEELQRARIVVTTRDDQDVMTLLCEVSSRTENLTERLKQCVREVCNLRSDIELVQPGEIPRDGVVIEDARSYE